MYVHQAKPANPERTAISSSLKGGLREQFRLPSNQRAAVRVQSRIAARPSQLLTTTTTTTGRRNSGLPPHPRPLGPRRDPKVEKLSFLLGPKLPLSA
jgi:hypothetical protein